MSAPKLPTPAHARQPIPDASPEEYAQTLLATPDLERMDAQDLCAHYERVREPVSACTRQSTVKPPAPLDLSGVAPSQHERRITRYREALQDSQRADAERDYWVQVGRALRVQTEIHVVGALRRDLVPGWTDAQFGAIWSEAYERGHAYGLSGMVESFDRMAEAIGLFLGASTDADHPPEAGVSGSSPDMAG